MYFYDGLDEQELSFPSDVYIRLLRRNLPKKKVDNETWYEGVYENKIGFFPSIFVEEENEELDQNDYLKISNKDDNIDHHNLNKIGCKFNNDEQFIQSPDNQTVPNGT